MKKETVSMSAAATVAVRHTAAASSKLCRISQGSIHEVSTNGHLIEPNGGNSIASILLRCSVDLLADSFSLVFGSSGNGICLLHGNHYAWNNSNSHQQHPSGARIWPNSLSFVNGVQHMPAFPWVPSVMLDVASPFSLGISRDVGFPGSSPSHPVEIASHNIFSHAGGNNGVVYSPQQMCHLFPGRNPVISMPGSFESPNERVRNFWHHRNELNSNSADKKQYELDIDCIICGKDSRTTLMIKNIPNKYTSKVLLAAIDEHCQGTYDFIYLPIDFKAINRIKATWAMHSSTGLIWDLDAFNGKIWEKFNSEKVALLAYARIQGKAALIAHFQNSSLMNEDKQCRHVLFHTDGPNAGDQEPFPMGTKIRSKPGKPQTTTPENNSQVSSSTSAKGEEPSNGVEPWSGYPKYSN
ncbi:hypothetical protein SLEP1_g57032 [Rubroshorea leprosula]|uniref:Mei2-like C-terminal RNA recognition motif domain-containing protein n=1 Tax=Rubroshorea leprosula TaxID=152421 RepID=A0AAV5MPH7_9ROSI|nr:hypothetical protein SLEP1_g57032 [Rubroshorea leprosula]